MRHSLRAVSLSWLIVLVPILAGAAARNKAPIAKNDAAQTAMDTSVTINVTANDRDRDGRIVRKTVRIVGAGPRHGRAGKRRNGTVTYTPNPRFSGQDTFRYRVKDNLGALSNRARVRVTVLPGARSPVANNDTVATAVNTPVVINVVANDTDADGNLDPQSVAIATNPASGGLVNHFDGTVTYTPSAGFFGTDAFAYTVRDGQGATSNVATVTVAVNAGPVAEAGPGQNAVTGQPVTLNGSASSDPDGNTLAFSWRFLSIPLASARADADIVNPTSPAPSFTPDVDGDYELELTVTDGSLSDTDGVVITAAATGRVPPNAEAGPAQSAEVLTLVTLNGSASNDPDNGPNPLTFRWAFAQVPSGSARTNANITNATRAQASFTPDVTGLYRLTLTVSDGTLSDSDDIDINVTQTNVPPNANAGRDIVVQLGGTATLNGSASDDPDDFPNPTLTFQWTFVSRPTGSTVTNITDATTARARFTPDVAGDYVLRLVVSDGRDTDDAQVMVKAEPPQQPRCGDRVVTPPEQCDDGNTTSGDGCSSTCTVEPPPPRCGDGAVNQPNEQCDDGNTTSGDGCSATCTVEPRCGDGTITPPEQCDDSNTTNGDGCSSTCAVEVRLSTDVQTIFNMRCAACHNGTNPPQPSLFSRPDLRAGNAFAAITGDMGPIDGSLCVGTPPPPPPNYVVPRDPDGSLLVQKLGATPPCGSRMPIGTPLTSTEVDTIRAWIMQGALDN